MPHVCLPVCLKQQGLAVVGVSVCTCVRCFWNVYYLLYTLRVCVCVRVFVAVASLSRCNGRESCVELCCVELCCVELCCVVLRAIFTLFVQELCFGVLLCTLSLCSLRLHTSPISLSLSLSFALISLAAACNTTTPRVCVRRRRPTA